MERDAGITYREAGELMRVSYEVILELDDNATAYDMLMFDAIILRKLGRALLFVEVVGVQCLGKLQPKKVSKR